MLPIVTAGTQLRLPLHTGLTITSPTTPHPQTTPQGTPVGFLQKVNLAPMVPVSMTTVQPNMVEYVSDGHDNSSSHPPTPHTPASPPQVVSPKLASPHPDSNNGT